MRLTLRYFILCVFCALNAIALKAQSITVSAPSHVAAGENFRLAYTVNTQDVEEFRAGNIPGALEVLAGPYTSSQSSFQMINGHTSSSSSVTFTYTLYASKDGTFKIPPAYAIVNGKRIHSHAVTVHVSGHVSSSNNQQPSMHQNNVNTSRMQSAGTPISGNDLFIRVSANKKHVHEQEPVLLTYKVYTQVDLTQLEGKMPDLKGFHSQEVQLPQQKSFHLEKVGGKTYKCVTWSQYVMYPQMTGKLTIPSITFNGIVVQENRSVDPFEAFFNGGSGYVEVKKSIKAPSIDITVDPLPNRPTDFSGGVGKFNISAQLDKRELKSGNPINLRIVVGGIGNLKLIKQPVVNFPKDFDTYDPKVTDKTKLTANGLEGNMVYDFMAVPRNQGTYTIPSVTFTYYDVTQNAYKTIKTQPFTIHVERGDGGLSSSADFTQDIDKDIHAIKKGPVELSKKHDFFFGSTSYTIWLTICICIFVALLIVFRQRALENADMVGKRRNRANKIASKRLKKASQLMFKNRQAEFYDEVLRALWGYVGDKLNMPVVTLSRDNIQDNLANNHVDSETIKKFVSALDECEFERYAPGDPTGNMNKTFESAMTAIEHIEDSLKASKKARKSGFHTLLLLFAFVMVSLSAQAAPKSSADAASKKIADSEYLRGNYHQAIKDYNEILKRGVSADIYYNLGNSYYRTDNLTQAILAYERAYLLAPGDADIRFNLQFASSKTIDKITPINEMFFVTWYHSLVNFTSVDNWACMAIGFIIVALVLTLIYLFSYNILMRKIGFFGGILFIVLFLMANLFAFQQKQTLLNRSGAIVIAPTVNVMKTPSTNSTQSFVIHEGTHVDITDKTMKDWRGIKLADGREGWIETKQIEEI
ncbi:BatD family protein [Segatella bryantii]|uniref:BatD family protein n=2 Tax=Segatella bryantii TaxID=77095 RepID=UPI00088D5D78|nr:BatD family protein [Segatella bryantii]MEE3415397.1 BatD family protein [Prevotella sp.]SDL52853.1 Tetratricopeptide (TPR) repeat [Segatella bryantii]